MSFEGAEGPALAQRAFQAARLLRERLLVDLDLTACLAVHAAVRPEFDDVERFRGEVRRTCERLQRATPADTLAVSPEIFLSLSDADRRHLSPLVELEGDGLTASIFPALAAQAPSTLRESGPERYGAKFRGYLESSAVRRLRYVGFRLQKKEPPSLDIFDVFVVPKVDVRKLPAPGTEPLAQMSPELLVDLGLHAGGISLPKALPFPQALQQYKVLIVLGDPGSGKTTLLKWLALLAARGPLTTHAVLGTALHLLPLLISVGRLAELRSTLGEAAAVVDVMARYFRERNVDEDEAGVREFLDQMLRQGRCLVLLDGLDEVHSEAREGVMRWLESFAIQYPANRFIASARQVGYVGLDLPGAAEVTLGPFEDEQVRRYVHSFQRAYKAWEEGSPDDVTADRSATQLLEALFANQRLHELSRNPFILSSLALIHRAEGQLPRHRVQAYEIFARTLCETWGQARRIVAGGPEEEQLRYEEEAVPILGRLALEMHRKWPTGVAPESFIVEVLTSAIQEREGTAPETASRSAREFLKKAGADVQILLERGAGRWGFLHLTFQEFFAAMGLHAAEQFFEEGRARLFQSRWEEILRLGVGYMALVQKRAEGARRFIQDTLNHQERGRRAYITQVLRKQIPLAVLFATEAGDTLPAALQDRLAEQFSEWLCTMPPSISEASFNDVRLSDFSGRLAQPLLRLAGSDQPRVRAQAIFHLGRLKVPAAASVIISALDDNVAQVRAAAAAAVEAMRLAAASERLEELLSEHDTEVKASAASALLVLRPKRLLEIMRSWEQQGDFATNFAMVIVPGLGRTPAGAGFAGKLITSWKGSENPLLQVLQVLSEVLSAAKETSEVSAGSDSALLAPEQDQLSSAFLRLLRIFLSTRDMTLRQLLLACAKQELTSSEYLLLQGSPQADEMNLALRLLQVSNPSTKLMVAVLLKGHPEGIRALIHLTQSPDVEVRRNAIAYLSSDQEKEVLPVLLATSKDSDVAVRQQVAHGLKRWQSPESKSCLISLLNDPDQGVRERAASSLGSLKAEEAIEPLVRMTSSSDAAERDAALNALWAIASA
ncbi:MAG: HEAT repeat domain-containing protein [Myxococcaceae bacterium]|nr:HEAT repeat domain-containing protein [Myxococcaceae bacterium]